MFPSMKSTISLSEGEGFFFSKATADMIIPEVQYPHCSAPTSRKACWTAMKLITVRESLNRGDLFLRPRCPRA